MATGKAFLTQIHIVSMVMVFGAMLLLISESVYYIKRSGELALMRNQKKKFLPNGIILSGIIFCIGLLLIFYLLFSK
jgi:hypothetical protein